MMPRLLCLLLLLLAGSPTARPAPPTCYSRMLSLSREVTGDFQNLQATEPSEPCVRYLPRLYLDIHVRGSSCLGRWGWSGKRAQGRRRQEPPTPICPATDLPHDALSAVHSQNHCVLAKLRDFVASPQCWKVAQVDGLKDKVRKLYTIMNSFCRRVSDMPENAFPACYQPRCSGLLEEEG
uniref:Cytokine like 1 n=1 Tax=Canis lupus familiaris TaxID=9615 RepID=A0A8C0LYT8_CANLF